MAEPLRALWLGRANYAAVHAAQEALVAARVAGAVPDTVLLVEHPPTITLGRRKTAAAGVLRPEGVDVVQVERGGEATWHAPGQLVAYPVIALEGARQDLRDHLSRLEDAVIATIQQAGLARGVTLAPHRDARNTGVWLTDAAGVARKTCSIGIACRRWVTWHGLALNVDMDLAGFARIQPCGFGADIMTRLADHGLDGVTVQGLVPVLARALAHALDRDLATEVQARPWREGRVAGQWIA